MKALLALLILTSFAVPLSSLPILAILKTNVVTAPATSHADCWATGVWLDYLYSWNRGLVALSFLTCMQAYPKLNPEMIRRILDFEGLWDTTVQNERKSHLTCA